MDSLGSNEQKDKITTILNQVTELTESERHVLYVRLSDVSDESSKNPPTSTSRRSDLALRWIRTHYVKDKDVCVPKQDVYDQYRQHCETSGNIPLSISDFGKMMKLVFPDIHDRRLGQRGKSIYCYRGLRNKQVVDSSSPTESLPSDQTDDLCLYTLSCQLVCEWATQLLGRPFVDIRKLSEYLVSKGLSCGKTAAKFSLLSGSTSLPKLFDKDRKSPNSKHHDRQLLLQRKLLQNELIREHKEKLKEQQKLSRELLSANAECVRLSFTHPAADSLKTDDPNTARLPGFRVKKIQLRPSSVQPYVPSVSTNYLNKKHEVSSAGSEQNAAVLGNDGTHSLSAVVCGSAGVGECLSVPLPPKRCHSTSVVEKQSSSVLFSILGLTCQVLEKSNSSTDTNSGCEIDDGKASSFSSSTNTSVQMDSSIISSSSESLSIGVSPPVSVLSHLGAQRNITRLLESHMLRASNDGLLMPQHPKRYGDNISPDRSSLTKRKCTTSLGVTKQLSLESSLRGKENPDLVVHRRLRPYSCPVPNGESQFNAIVKDEKCSSNFNFVDLILKKELADSSIIRHDPCLANDNYIGMIWKKELTESGVKHETPRQTTVTSSPILLSDSRKVDENIQNKPEQQKKNSGVCHFVQKPIVINRPKLVAETGVTGPESKQDAALGDTRPVHQEPTVQKQSYNILNSLLSSNYDASKPITSVRASLPVSPLTSSLTSSHLSPHVSADTSSLHGSQLRLMANTSHAVESPSILSSLSSRSAFVPVTSHKLQMANSGLKDTDVPVPAQSAPKQPAGSFDKDKDPLELPSTSAILQPLQSLINSSVHTPVKPVISHSLVSETEEIPKYHRYKLQSVGITGVNFKKYGIAVTSNSSSSSSSSSSSTLCRESSGCESVLTTPVPAPVCDKSNPLLASVGVSGKDCSHTATSGSPDPTPVPQCKPPPSQGCTTPVMSPPVSRSVQTRTTTSPITPPKKSGRNRFTPIRPKIGGGGNTPSPQKLAGIASHSPQKKDMRPVSAILNEQRVKCAQDLLVNLANSYKGEVKLQMPAELLGLSPAGKNKSADVHVTIRPPSNSSSVLQNKIAQPTSSELGQHLWSLTSPAPVHAEMTVIVEPVSHSSSQPIVSPSVPSCVMSATPAPILQTFPPTAGVQVVTNNLCNNTQLSKPFFSPTVAFHPHQTPAAGSGTQVIILPPPISCFPSNDNSSLQSIIIEDNKGNKYSLDEPSACAVLPQNLQHFLQSNPLVSSAKSADLKTQFVNTFTGHLNLSDIKGQVIGPDSYGQSYLLVPNSEPVIGVTSLTSSVPTTESSSLVTTGLTTTPSTVLIPSATGVLQPHVTSSAVQLSELNQLANSGGQNSSVQTFIQHNSGQSAFHKCASSSQRKADGHDGVGPEGNGDRTNVPVVQSFNYQLRGNNSPKAIWPEEASCNVSKSAEGIEGKNDSQFEQTSDPHKLSGLRKRKAGREEEDEHDDRKRLNSCTDQKEKDVSDDDVLIVKIEDRTSKSASDISNLADCNVLAESLRSTLPRLATSVDDSHVSANRISVEEKREDKRPLITDTETLLGLIGDSKSMTVKETIRALNQLRAGHNYSGIRDIHTAGVDGYGQAEVPANKVSVSSQGLKLSSSAALYSSSDQLYRKKTDIKSVTYSRSHSVRSSSASPYPVNDVSLGLLNQESTCSLTDTTKIKRTGRRHISLNLESLESDALLDTEPTLDHRLVGDIKNSKSTKSSQKLSVGIAVKSGRSKQHKRDIKASKMTLLNDKKTLDKVFSCVSKTGPQRSPLEDEMEHPRTVSNDISRPQQEAGNNNTVTKSEHSSEQRRSMSCVRDILQRGTKHELNNYMTATVDFTADPELQIAKAPLSLNRSSVSKHPCLARCLEMPIKTDKNHIVTSQLTLEKDVSASEQNVVAHSNPKLPENELPLDIADFITESMSSGNSYGCDAFRRNSLTTLLADLVRNGQIEKEQGLAADGQNVVVWRSVSVPNTISDAFYDFKTENREKCQLSSNRTQSMSESGDDSLVMNRHLKQTCSDEELSKLPFISWERSTESQKNIQTLDLNSENEIEKSVCLEYTCQPSEGGVSSGTFLSPIGPAKLTRRSSVERSSSSERPLTKTPVECLASKAGSERPQPRIKTPTDRNLTKISADRPHTVIPVENAENKNNMERFQPRIRTLTDRTINKMDRSHTKTPVDRCLTVMPLESRKKSTDRSVCKLDNHCEDKTTAIMLQQSTKERDFHKHSGSRLVNKSPADKVLTSLMCESLLSHRSVDGCLENMKTGGGNRSLNQTPVSDAGYSSVSQTPVSDVGYNSVTPSPVMMSISGLFGECNRQELTSPATIFMPLRSDSALSVVNNGRYSDGSDAVQTGPQEECLRTVLDVARCLPYYEKYCQKLDPRQSLFDQDNAGQGISLLQNNNNRSSLVDEKNKDDVCGGSVIPASEGLSIKDTSLLFDIMSAQLNCIPTPPCSPSTSPQHLADTSQSPLSFHMPSSQDCPPPHSQQSYVLPTSLSSSRNATQFSSITKISSHVTCLISSGLNVVSSSPGLLTSVGQHSPNVLSSISSSPYGTIHSCSSPHQYNPHPSPPFTPSSQRCLVSPRCPTPCSHRSVMSPSCATPVGDPHSAPNRFMPIQTSGILTTSLTATHTYIQPIRPVVTLASAANQSNHSGLVFAEHPFAKISVGKTMQQSTAPPSDITSPFIHDQKSGTLQTLNTADMEFAQKPDGLNCSQKVKDDVFYHRKLKRADDHKDDRSSHPALILSLTGNIGCVSGQGMQAGWKKDLHPASPSDILKKGHHSYHWRSRRSRPDISLSEVSLMHSDMAALVNGPDSCSNQVSLEMASADLLHKNVRQYSSDQNESNDDIHKVGSHNADNNQTGNIHQVDGVSQIVEDKINPSQNITSVDVSSVHSDHFKDISFAPQRVIQSEGSKSVNRNRAYDHKFMSTSHLNLYQKFAEHKYNTSTISSPDPMGWQQTSSFSGQPQPCDGNSFDTDNVKAKSFQNISNLPTAYYAGTAPNIDLTKSAFALSAVPPGATSQPPTSLQHSMSESQLGSYLINLNSQFASRLDNQDELDETLNVLKNLDSQYFQYDDDDDDDINIPEAPR